MPGVKFSQKIFDKLCERVAEGEAVHNICAEKGMPSRVTFYKWLRDDDDLANSYVRAREEQADRVVDECIAIADQCDDASKARVQIAARQWKASKMAPKRYGDKLALTGGDGGPIKTATVPDIENMTPAQLKALDALLKDNGDSDGG